MSEEGIPEEIQRFILLNIESVAKLEALLLMRSQAGQIWDAELLAGRLYISPGETAQILAELEARRMCVLSDVPAKKFRYQPVSPELADLIDRLAELYSRRLVAITNLIHQRGSVPGGKRSAQQFADAFKLRKDKED